MVSVTSALAALAVLAMATLAVGASVVAGSITANASGSHVSGGEPRCDPSDAIRAALGHREPGQTVGSVISEIAQMCRPQIRH